MFLSIYQPVEFNNKQHELLIAEKEAILEYHDLE